MSNFEISQINSQKNQYFKNQHFFISISMLTFCKLHIVFYNAIKINAIFDEFKFTIENFINLCFLTKRRFVNVLIIKNIIEFNKTKKSSFFRYSSNLKNDLYCRRTLSKITSFNAYIMIQ